MNFLNPILEQLVAFVTLGGPVVAILCGISVASLAIVLYKIAQFQSLGVGRRRGLERALAAYDQGDKFTTTTLITKSRSHLRFLLAEATEQEPLTADPQRLAERLLSRADARLAQLERGFRPLEIIAQMAPLLGLFGTVLGMITAFQNLQDAGTSVDPSLLAGGIWVALMTTAAGLAVAMPTSILLSWLESRVQGERVFIDKALNMLLCPQSAMTEPSDAAA